MLETGLLNMQIENFSSLIIKIYECLPHLDHQNY